MNKFFASIILMVAGLGLLLTLARTNYNSYLALNEEIGVYDQTLAQADQLNDLEADLLEKYNAIPIEQRSRVEKLLPRNIDTVRLTIEISEIANKNNVEISSLSFSKNESQSTPNAVADESSDPLADQSADPTSSIAVNQSGSGYSSVDMSFSATGAYNNLVSFVESLENNLRLTDMQSLTVSASTDETQNITYNLVIRTYWLGT